MVQVGARSEGIEERPDAVLDREFLFHMHLAACVYVSMRVRACVRACVRVSVCACLCAYVRSRVGDCEQAAQGLRRSIMVARFCLAVGPLVLLVNASFDAR